MAENHDLVRELSAWARGQIIHISQRIEVIVAAIDDLNNAVSGLQSSADGLMAVVTSLESAVAAGVSPAQVESAVSALNALKTQIDSATSSAHAALNPPAPAAPAQG